MKEYLENQLQYCGNKAFNFTCQVLEKAEAKGSGVLIQINGVQYLISAAHVLEPSRIEWRTIPNGEELIEIEGTLLTTEIPKGSHRRDDKIDIGIVRLSEDCSIKIGKRFRFLTESDIDLLHIELESHQYMFLGYPIETTIIDRQEMSIIPTPLLVRTKILGHKLLVNLPKYEKGTKWILDFDRGKQINISKQIEEFAPDPHGVSGSGLWSIPVNPGLPVESTNMKLVGILTDYFAGGDKVVCATNIRLFIDAIKKYEKEIN